MSPGAFDPVAVGVDAKAEGDGFWFDTRLRGELERRPRVPGRVRRRPERRAAVRRHRSRARAGGALGDRRVPEDPRGPATPPGRVRPTAGCAEEERWPSRRSRRFSWLLLLVLAAASVGFCRALREPWPAEQGVASCPKARSGNVADRGLGRRHDRRRARGGPAVHARAFSKAHACVRATRRGPRARAAAAPRPLRAAGLVRGVGPLLERGHARRVGPAPRRARLRPQGDGRRRGRSCSRRSGTRTRRTSCSSDSPRFPVASVREYAELVESLARGERLGYLLGGSLLPWRWLMALGLPTANATRHPVMLYAFEQENSSMATSLAPGALEQRRRTVAVVADLRVGVVVDEQTGRCCARRQSRGRSRPCRRWPRSGCSGSSGRSSWRASARRRGSTRSARKPFSSVMGIQWVSPPAKMPLER